MNKRLEKARAEHNKWLEARGLMRKQIEMRRDDAVRIVRMPNYKVDENAPLGNGFARSGFVITPMANRFNEKPSVRAEIERKAMRIAPAYSKGPMQFVSDGADIETLGKKV